MSDKPTVDQLIGTYIKIRDAVKAADAEHAERTAKMKADMELIANTIQDFLNTSGAESIKSDHGTAFFKAATQASIADWDTFLTFVKANDAWDMLTKGVSSTAVAAWMEIHHNVPAGVNHRTERKLYVRRS